MTAISIIRGDDVTFQLTFTDVDGNAIDLTDATVFFTAKKHLKDADADAVITKEVTSFAAPVTGIALLTLTDTQTSINPGLYYYDIQLKDSAGFITSSGQGRLKVEKDVTIRTS